jgi:poly-gamma-glutamate capsule biosynthesis protein CapA/YwtB (metallophosphatase superfamily)
MRCYSRCVRLAAALANRVRPVDRTGRRARPGLILLALGSLLLGGACGRSGAGKVGAARESTRAVRLIFAGDIMLGRGVAPVAKARPYDLFAGIRFEISSADLAMANLESPLTKRAHVTGPDALEAPPSSARLLGLAGLDAVTIANNHAGDAGPGTVRDTMRALAAAKITVVGAGSSREQALAPRIVPVAGLRVALLAFDTTMEGPAPANGEPGVARWSGGAVQRAVKDARSQADIVVVALHGGAPYAPETDPYVMRLGRQLASWGADVVWAAGPHVVQPVHLIDGRDGRPAIVATSLGNLIFDQHIPGTRRGALLEVLAGAEGVRAYRVGRVAAVAPADFIGWKAPSSDAVALEGGWWTLAHPVTPAPVVRPRNLARFGSKGKVTSAAVGNAEGNGERQLVVSFRRPFRRTNVDALVPRQALLDRHNLTAHIGLYRPRDLRPLWVAGTLLRPVARLAVCDGALAVAYSTLNDPSIAGTGAWRWSGFGFTPQTDLPGRGVPACADVDGDGRLDPLILERSRR